MSEPFEIPLINQPQLLGVTLNGVGYQLRVIWNDFSQCWVMDLLDGDGNPIIQGIPLVTGTDLISQFKYLVIGGQFIVQSDNDTDVVPTFTSLGDTGHLYFVTP
jgi:hypothetical protein